MYKSTQTLIQEMAEDLQPVRALRLRSGLLLLLAAVGLTVLGIALLSGLWAGVWQGEASALFLTTNGLLLILGGGAMAVGGPISR